MSARAYDLVLFDLDGTLIETAPEIQDAVNDTLQALGHEPIDLTTITNWIGHGTRELLLSALARSRGSERGEVALAEDFPSIIEAFAVNYLRRCGSRSQPYPGMHEALAALRSAGCKLGIVTNKEARYTQQVLEAHGLDERLDIVIAGDTLPVKKPDPAGIELARQRFGASLERTLFVGDSSIDVAAARRAGVAVWVFPWGYNMGQPIAECGPDRILQGFAELTPIILPGSA